MNFSLPFNAKPLAVLGALAWTTLTIGSAIAPAPAQAGGAAFYRAELTAPAAKPTTIAGGLVWKCAETQCGAAKGTSRPAIVCARLARAVGPVSSFTADGKALDADELARCNAA